jgi:putative hemolysin
LVPKQFALRNAEAIACRVAVPMRWLSRLATPFVWLLDGSGRFLIRLLGGSTVNENIVTDEEIRALIEEAETAGVIESGERSMIAGVMRLGDRPVRTFMTPLTDVDMVGIGDEPAALRRQVINSAHSRLPVHGETPDELLGILRAKDIADALLAGKKFDIKKLVKKIPSIPESMPALEALELFRDSAIHLAFVQDEYGRTLGVLSPSDLLEAISGSVSTGTDDEPKSVKREDGSWLLSGNLTVDELSDLIGISLPSKRRFDTVAGLMLDAFKYLPGLGEATKIGAWRFEVVDLDGRRIDKVVASRLPDTHRPGIRAGRSNS